MKHYLLLTFADGKDSVRREYFALTDPDETPESALDRWVESHPDMVTRVRNRDKVGAALKNSPLYVRLCRPSSWYRDNKQGAFAEPNGNGTKKSTVKRGKKS